MFYLIYFIFIHFIFHGHGCIVLCVFSYPVNHNFIWKNNKNKDKYESMTKDNAIFRRVLFIVVIEYFNLQNGKCKSNTALQCLIKAYMYFFSKMDCLINVYTNVMLLEITQSFWITIN